MSKNWAGPSVRHFKQLAASLRKRLSRVNLRGVENGGSKNISAQVLDRLEVAVAVSPGIFFVLLGLSILFAPPLLPLLLAAFCISFGIICCVLSLRFLRLKKKLSIFSHQIEARFVIDPGKVADPSQREQVESKKVVFH